LLKKTNIKATNIFLQNKKPVYIELREDIFGRELGIIAHKQAIYCYKEFWITLIKEMIYFYIETCNTGDIWSGEAENFIRELRRFIMEEF